MRTVCLSIDVETSEDELRAWEVLARAAAGLSIEGNDVRLYVFRGEDEEDSQ